MTINEIKERINKIQGWFGDENFEVLMPYIQALSENSLLVEIGTYHGKSTLFWRLVNPKIRILTIDVCSQEGIGTQENQITIGTIIPKHLDDEVLKEGNIFQVTHSSHEVVKTFNWSIDFLFIDSEHSYQDTLDNLNEWGKFVKPNHFMVCHDYNQESFPGVVQGVAEYLKQNPKVIKVSEEGGVAILKV